MLQLLHVLKASAIWHQARCGGPISKMLRAGRRWGNDPLDQPQRIVATAARHMSASSSSSSTVVPDDVPSSGVILRGAQEAVLIARFDDDPGGAPSARRLLPDFTAAKPPLRMRVTAATERTRSATGIVTPATAETWSLQDASGAHNFLGERQNLDSHYSA